VDHTLNQKQFQLKTDSDEETETVLQIYGSEIKKKLRAALDQQSDIVRIGGTWFPKSLLIDIGQGQLNLAEAVLDAQKGGPLNPQELLSQLD